MLKFKFLNFSFQFNLENTKDSTYFLKQGYVKLKTVIVNTCIVIFLIFFE